MKKIISALLVCVLLVGCMFVLASCGGPNSDPAKALAALKDKDYAAAEDKVIVPTALRLAGVEGIDTVISGTKTDEDDKIQTITIIYFDEAADANEAWEAVQEYAEKNNDEEETDWVVAKSGAMIYFGTKQGASDAA